MWSRFGEAPSTEKLFLVVEEIEASIITVECSLEHRERRMFGGSGGSVNNRTTRIGHIVAPVRPNFNLLAKSP